MAGAWVGGLRPVEVLGVDRNIRPQALEPGDESRLDPGPVEVGAGNPRSRGSPTCRPVDVVRADRDTASAAAPGGEGDESVVDVRAVEVGAADRGGVGVRPVDVVAVDRDAPDRDAADKALIYPRAVEVGAADRAALPTSR